MLVDRDTLCRHVLLLRGKNLASYLRWPSQLWFSVLLRESRLELWVLHLRMMICGRLLERWLPLTIAWLHVLLLQLKLGKLCLVIDHLLLDVVLHVCLHLRHVISLELLLFVMPMLLGFKRLELRKVHLTPHGWLLRLHRPLIRVRLVSVALSVVAVALLSVLIISLFHLHGPVLDD